MFYFSKVIFFKHEFDVRKIKIILIKHNFNKKNKTKYMSNATFIVLKIKIKIIFYKYDKDEVIFSHHHIILSFFFD